MNSLRDAIYAVLLLVHRFGECDGVALSDHKRKFRMLKGER